MSRVLFASAVGAVVAIGSVVMPARGAEIVGRVVDQSRASVAGLQLSVVNQAGAQIAVTTPDATGSYTFRDIAPGTYSLNLNGQSVVAYVPPAGLTVNWGIAQNFPPVALAKQGVTIPGAAGNAPVSATR
jgi:hypothetical protein